MPRASWSGFLRLSLVTCPVYLTPATTEAKRIRLHQLNSKTGNRVAQRLVDSKTGEEVTRDQIVKGFEFDRDRYVTLDDDELRDLKIESSKIVELDRFVDRAEVDELYLDTPYYVYPDGQIAGETFGVIGEAMTRADKVGLGRIVLANRERQVLIEPRGAGLVMSTLRASDEVRAADFEDKGAEGEADPEMVALATTIIERKAGAFDPADFHDHYQEALRELVQSKLKGEVIAAPEEAPEPPKVINLMDALKRSLAREETGAGRSSDRTERAAPAAETRPEARRAAKPAADRRQRALLLPVAGGRNRQRETEAEPAREAAAPAAHASAARRGRARAEAAAEPEAAEAPAPRRRRKA
jgi:DNA end-binding protein Ku